jgi:hypothetical protein
MQARMDVRLAMYNTVKQYMKIWEESNPRPRDDTFSKWAEDRYCVFKTFMGTFSTQEQEDYYIDDSTFWEIETVPFEG